MILAIASGDETLIKRLKRDLGDRYALVGFNHLKSLSSALPRLSPSLVIIDGEFSKLKDMRSLQSLCRQNEAVRFVVVTNCVDLNSELQFLRAGVRGLLPRDASPLYGPMVEALIRGEFWFSRRAISLFLEERGLVRRPGSPAEACSASLSERERQVAKMAIAGASNKHIADFLRITERTVKAHLSQIFLKLRITQRSELFPLEKELLFLCGLAVVLQ